MLTKDPCETTNEQLNSNDFQKTARNVRAQNSNCIPEFTGAYVSFEFSKETT